MENTLLTVMLSGFTFFFTLMCLVWKSLNSRIDKMGADLIARIERESAELNARMDRTDKELNARMDRIESRIDRIEVKIDRLEDQLNDIFRFLCRIEGSLATKDCCMLKHDDKNKKAL